MKFSRSMVKLVQDYLDARRSLGFLIENEGKELIRFGRFVDQSGYRGSLTSELAVQWAKLPQNADSLYWAKRLNMVRRFAKYRLVFDPQTEVAPADFFGPSTRRPTPYIYSKKEIAALLNAASKVGRPRGLRSRTYFTLFGLLACTGLRVSEALRLTKEDVDLETGILTIRATKSHGPRFVPIHSTTKEALLTYSKDRNQYHPQTTSKAFFLTERGTPLSYHKTILTFVSLRKVLRWNCKRLPRIHDLRHSFAVRQLITWYQAGADLEQKIPVLSTYLGHTSVSSTYWYFSAVPELFGLASRRFENSWKKFTGGQHEAK